MRVLIFGEHGQLGSALRTVCTHSGVSTVSPMGRDGGRIDITDRLALESVFDAGGFDCVVNAAAYTAVDLAEDQKEQARLVNEIAVGNLADLCRGHRCAFVHFSTDYVFDGEKNSGYIEEDCTQPTSVYGASKRAGEIKILEIYPEALICRVSWLFGVRGRNFVKTMLNLARNRTELHVVNDQVGGPTFAGDVAQFVVKALLLGGAQKAGLRGVLHIPSLPAVSWYEFACAIITRAEHFQLIEHPVSVKPVSSSDFPSKVKRPKNSVLESIHFGRLGFPVPDWQVGLDTCLQQWVSNPALLWYD